MENTRQSTVPGVILAGGLSRRMGGPDKCLIPLAGRPILTHIVERIRPQVSALALNANGDPSRFADFALSVIPDESADFAGPLAGVLAALDWAAGLAGDFRAGRFQHVLTVPGDTPFLPPDLVARLGAGLAKGAELALAASGRRSHPVVALWPLASREDLRRAIRGEGLRKVETWASRFVAAAVEFEIGAEDPFLNINTPDDLAEAERRLKTG
jgi:molybdopterin-guanine dinucleotide biosynthesis protein A